MSDLPAAKVQDWLGRYRRAWIDRDPDLVVSLFTSDAHYRESPFEPAMVGHAAIRAYWQQQVVRDQTDIDFAATLWATVDETAVAHWRAAFTRPSTGKRHKLEGVFRLRFARGGDGDPLCSDLDEWWMMVAEPA